MKQVYVVIGFPGGMAEAEAIQRAKALCPFKTGAWELEQNIMAFEGHRETCGNLEFEKGAYRRNPDFNQYGPDSSGVTLTWEKP